MQTVYGAWTVCKSQFELYRWYSKYSCFSNNYSTTDKPSQILMSSDIEHSLFLPITKYKPNSGDDKICRIVISLKQAIANRNKFVDAYMTQLESLVDAKQSNLFNKFFNGISNCYLLIKLILLKHLCRSRVEFSQFRLWFCSCWSHANAYQCCGTVTLQYFAEFLA